MTMPRTDLCTLQISDTPVWRIYKQIDGRIEPILDAWHVDLDERRFLTGQTFGTKVEAVAWIKDFWYAYWTLVMVK